uniref:Uncharacterized protein n=1 Tax=Cacopsylla melanoneura TaxID=428564 RepID=A0A8D8YW27_9HEMI
MDMTYDGKIQLMKRTMQALYPISVFCGLLTFPDRKNKGFRYRCRQMIFPILWLMLTTAILAHEFPNMFVVRGKKIAVKRHKSSKYNLYVIHVVYLFKLYTTIFVFLRKSKWLPIIYYEIFKISELS